MTQLTPHFTLEDMVRSDIATRKCINNVPSPEVIANLRQLCDRLEIVRSYLGNNPMIITSGFRCAQLNSEIGGSATSDHVSGWAADFLCPAFGDPEAVCKEIESSAIIFDQLIFEGTWTHISFSPKSRGDVLTAHFHPGGVAYTDGIGLA